MVTSLSVSLWGLSRDGDRWHLFRPGARPARKAGKRRAACGAEMWLADVPMRVQPLLAGEVCMRCRLAEELNRG